MAERDPSPRAAGRLLRMPQVVAETSLSQATINRLHRRGEFPPKVQISARCTGWHEADIAAWKARRPTTPRPG